MPQLQTYSTSDPIKPTKRKSFHLTHLAFSHIGGGKNKKLMIVAIIQRKIRGKKKPAIAVITPNGQPK